MQGQQKMSKFMNTLTTFGNWLYNLFLLQVLWVVYSLKGGLVLGIFPSLSGLVQVVYRWFNTKETDFKISQEYKKGFQTNFKQANQIGYALLIAALIFYIDLRVSNYFIQSILLHTFLLFLGLLILSMGLYTFTVLVRYDYKLKDIFKQSFFVALAVPVYTAAALISLLMVVELMRTYLFLFLFFGAPLIMIPIVWFTYSGIMAAEKSKANSGE